MADLARRKREDALRLKAWLEPHLPTFNRLQAILLWLDTTGQVQFVALCVAVHVALSMGAHLIEGVTLPAMVPYALGLYLLGRYVVVAAPIPWESILSVGATGAIPPYALDDVVQAVISMHYFVLTVLNELQRLRDINYAKYTAQLCVACFVVGLVLNRISGYTFVYIVVYTMLLVPGIYTYDVFGKLWALANSHPQVGRVTAMAQEHYTNLAGTLGLQPRPRPGPSANAPAPVPGPAPSVAQTAAPSVSVGSTTVNVNSNARKQAQAAAASVAGEDPLDDFVQIPSTKKHD